MQKPRKGEKKIFLKKIETPHTIIKNLAPIINNNNRKLHTVKNFKLPVIVEREIVAYDQTQILSQEN